MNATERLIEAVLTANPEESGGWIAHTPGPCPVADDVLVQVRYRCGVETSFAVYACLLKWHDMGGSTITHYRIVSAP